MTTSVEYDVAIVGAGPAGSLCAYQLAKYGYKTLLLDRASFPRYKVCGACLAPTALQVLESCELLSKVVPTEAPQLTRMRLYCGEKRATLQLPLGRAVSRACLDANMLDAAERAGAQVRTQTRYVKLIEHRADRVSFEVQSSAGLDLANSSTVQARLLIDASGLSAVVMRDLLRSKQGRSSTDLIGLGVSLVGSSLERGVIEMYLHEDRYIGVVSVENGLLDLAAACASRTAESSRGEINRIASRYAPPQAIDLRGTPVLSRNGALAIGRCIALGDSACYHEPFTGQGISWALSSGYQFSRLIVSHGIEHAVLAWPACYHKMIRPQMRACRAFGSIRRARLLGPRMISLVNSFPTIANLLSRYAWKEIELHS